MRNYEPLDGQEILLNRIFGRRKPHSLAEAYRLGQIPEEFMDEALKIMEGYPYPRNPNSSIATRHWEDDMDANGGWANVVMAYEDCLE